MTICKAALKTFEQAFNNSDQAVAVWQAHETLGNKSLITGDKNQLELDYRRHVASRGEEVNRKERPFASRRRLWKEDNGIPESHPRKAKGGYMNSNQKIMWGASAAPGAKIVINETSTNISHQFCSLVSNISF